MQYLRLLFFSLFIFTIFTSCDDCKDCTPLDNEDPTVLIKFYNATEFEDVKNKIETNTRKLKAYGDTIKTNQDDLDEENKRETPNGDNIKKYTSEIARLKTLSDSVQVILKELEEKRKPLANGETIIESLTIPGSAIDLSFTKDSLFYFPLRPDADFVTYLIKLSGREEKDILTLNYSRDPLIVNDRLKIFPRDLTIGESNTFPLIYIVPDFSDNPYEHKIEVSY